MQKGRSLARIAALTLLVFAGAPPATTVEAAGGSSGESDCPTASFPQVAADPANARYAEPYLQVSCTDRQVVIESNGIPPYRFQRTTPNDLRAQRYSWRLPRTPELADETTEVPLLGPIAVAINGLPIYGPNEGARPDPFGDPVYNDILDWCLGHTAQRGDYHYHSLVVACLTAGAAKDEPSPVIAYAFDGFPIYGSTGCADAECSALVEYRSSWERTGDPSTYAWENHRFVAHDDRTYLDACNGHVGPGGDYHYHATAGFPYILGCYRGYVDPSTTRPQRGR